MDKAAAPLAQVMNESKDSDLRQIARLRLARVQIGQGKSDEAIKTLTEPMSAAFSARYHEVRGDAYYSKKDVPAARTEYQAALTAAVASGINPALLELKIQDLGDAPAPVAEAFVASRIDGAGGLAYGTLPPSADRGSILERHRPIPEQLT